MLVRIQSSRTLANSVFFGGCASPQQRFWWMRDLTRCRWVDLGNRYMEGNKPIDVEVELEPGDYEAGCGPRGRRGIRCKFTVPEPPETLKTVVI